MLYDHELEYNQEQNAAAFDAYWEFQDDILEEIKDTEIETEIDGDDIFKETDRDHF